MHEFNEASRRELKATAVQRDDLCPIYVSEPMDREQFRAHCDRYQTQAAILSNLPGGVEIVPQLASRLVRPDDSNRNSVYAITAAGAAATVGIYAWFRSRRRHRSASPPGASAAV